MLIVRGADAGAAASDGTTPWYAACEHGSMDVLRVLQSKLQKANQQIVARAEQQRLKQRLGCLLQTSLRCSL